MEHKNKQHTEEQRSDLDSRGICVVCEANPQNAQLPSMVCLQCFHGNEYNNCEASGCPNPSRERFDKQVYCHIHFASSVAQAYGEYLKLRSEIEDMREHIDSKTDSDSTHPRDWDMPEEKMTADVKSVYDSWTRLKMLTKECNIIKRNIKHAMGKNVEVFHENYELFG